MLPFRRRQARRRGLLIGGLIGHRIGKRRAAHEADDASPAENRVAELERLADLRDRGALSPEEYEREKRRLLSD